MILSLLLIFAFLTLAVVRQLEAQHDEPTATHAACPGCSCRIDSNWLICPHCKELLQRSCPGCAAQQPVGHRFCSSCGDLLLHPLEIAACA